MPLGGVWGWVGPVVLMILGGLLRIVNLGQPHGIAFDETYYPKDALSMLRFGYERAMVDKANDILLQSDGNWRTLAIFKPDPAFVVHPPLGKWTIAAGEYVFGATPFGWRIAVAVLGTISILMVARIARRLTRSNLVGILAGFLLALDGMHLVLSRTGLLDMVLMFWVLAAFGLLLLDRDRTRRRLAAVVARDGLDTVSTQWGPRLGPRPLRWAAALTLGLACGVKWSALWYVAFFIALTLIWDVSARRVVGVRRPWVATIVRDAPATGISMLAIIAVVYVSTWSGWLLTDGGWARGWADDHPESWIPAALRSLWHYHVEAWNFHVGLDSGHAYGSNALSWPFQARPTAFYWDSIKDGSKGCPTDNCAAEVLALGNPIIWWAAIFAVIHQAWRWVGRRDWRSAAVLVGIAAGWVPWLIYLNRTIFTFYTIVYTPFIVIALAMSLATVLGGEDASPRRRRAGALTIGAFLLLVVAAAWWFYPVWTGEVIPYEAWRLRMWLPTWT
ncbi:MAG: phospholipid carrier-dependent glycosyltransferase [Actinobacteria bacterium]|nr:phospholipid carrier-dependent glycosyltransferase [Actinomycetota bacterium]